MAHKKDIAEDQIDNYVLSLMFAEDGPLMELMQPFISPAIGYERIQDVVHGDFLMGGRSGETAEGFKVYSPTDSLEDKFNKAFAHIVKGASPGLITSGMKLKAQWKVMYLAQENLCELKTSLWLSLLELEL